MNPYLARLRKQFDSLNSTIEGIQTRAAEADRDLTDDELRSVTEQAETAKTLAKQIEDLTEVETRSAAVAKLAGSVGDALPGAEQTRAVGGARTQDRDPGHYRSVEQGGKHSFFADMYRSKTLGDEEAARRLVEHNRALDNGTEGVGIVPPKWLIEEFQTTARQGRKVADAVRRIPIGNDPRTITIGKQTGNVDAEVTEQANENDAVEDDDAWDSEVDNVTIKPTSGIQIVSRQMLDASSPAIDTLIYGDLIDAYDAKVEAKVVAAMVTAAGTAVTTFATNAAFTGTAPAMPAIDAVIDTAIAVRNARKRPADIIVMNNTRYGAFLKLKDTTGRSVVVPLPSYGPANAAGIANVSNDGQIEGLNALPTDGVPSTFAESILVARSQDTLLFEGNMMRFRYEEPLGPESVKLGIWAYTGVHVRYSGASVKRFVVTAAS